ncbi:EMC3 protein, partial [Polyodon spathula]|nr:EMC3 protein [Polyodon spathula]
MRKHYFNDEETGFFKKTVRKVVAKNPMTDPSMLTDMMKGNLTNVLPMIVIGGWINWAFSGFVTTKVPFPLTLRFKPMLQRGIELLSLDASWFSYEPRCSQIATPDGSYLGVPYDSASTGTPEFSSGFLTRSAVPSGTENYKALVCNSICEPNIIQQASFDFMKRLGVLRY